MDTMLHVDDLIPGFVLGNLDDDEMLRAARHLSSCQACRHEMVRYAEVVDRLSNAAPLASPPSDLWKRLSTRIAVHPSPEAERAHRSSAIRTFLHAISASRPALLRAWAVVSLALIVALAAITVALWRPHSGAIPRAMLLPTFELFAAPSTPNGRGLLVASSDGTEGTLVVDGLAFLGDRQRYELWLLGNGAPASGALFNVEREGYATVIVHAPKPLTDYHAFSVTVGPSTGSASPLGTLVLTSRASSR